MDVDGSVDVSQSDSCWTVDVGTVPIKLADGTPLNVAVKRVNFDGAEVAVSGNVGLKVGSKSICFLAVPVPTPFAINIANVEYCKGRMNPDTNRYELKIGLVSGRDLTLEGEAAMSFLSSISENYSTDVDASKSLEAKFQSKSGS